MKELHALAEKLLEVPVPLIGTAIGLELGECSIVQDSVAGTGCIFLTGLHQAEKAIAERILNLAAGKPPWPEIDAGKAIAWLGAKSELAFAESQKQAIA